MINHVRTLLLNREGSERPAASFYGEEYVPTDFHPLELPSHAVNVWQTLFGTNPDNYFLNFRLWQYTRLLHSTEFVNYVTGLDSRITYDLDNSLVNYDYGVNMQRLFSGGTAQLHPVGGLNTVYSDGQMHLRWTATMKAGPRIEIKNINGNSVREHDVTWVAGQSSLFPLHGHGDNFFGRILAESAEAWVAERQWIVDAIMFPDMSLADVAARLANVGSSLDTLFSPDKEPYKSFGELWNYHSLLPYRLSGVLLALAYRIEELRVGAA